MSVGKQSADPCIRSMVVGVAPELTTLGRKGGHNKVWSIGIDELSKLLPVSILPWQSPQRPDIWLHNGHAMYPAVSEPVVSVVHEARWVDSDLRRDFAEAFLTSIEPATADSTKNSKRVIAPSLAGARTIAQLGMPSENIDVVPYGVDLTAFRPDLAGGRQIVAKAKGSDRPYVISVATAFRGKNLPLLRDIIGNLQERGFPHRLVLVAGRSGDGADSTDLLNDLKSGKGDLAVFQEVEEPQLVALLCGADAFCSLSRFEGFGLPALEALACGVPTVVSAAGALPEIVGGAGIVIADLKEAEHALAKVLGDPGLQKSLRTKARQRAETFTWQRMALGWKQSLQRALTGRP